MVATDADGGTPEPTLTERIAARLRDVHERYRRFRGWTATWTPTVVTGLEVLLTVVLVVGYAYWLVLFLGA
jgi:hypothetical protein